MKEKLKGSNQNPRAGAREDSRLQYDLPVWIPIAVWTAFIDHRKKLRAPMTEKAKGLAIRKLTNLRDEGHDPTAVIEQSILNGYRGLFPISASRHPGGRRSLDLYSLDF